jgi:phosphotransferase system HPr (HPr) family protein
MNKVTQEFIVENENGLHARPSSSFVKKANEFQSHIEVATEDGERVDGKSILGLMLLGASKGTKLTITAEGNDAREAIYAVGSLFKDKFGEN